MHTPIREALIGTVSVLLVMSASIAGPPLSGSTSETGSGWSKAMNPMQWKWPAMPWSEEPPRIQKKPSSMLSGATKSAKTGWEKTKRALDPTRLFDGGKKAAKPTPPTTSSSADGGFFSGMFKPEEETKEIKTVNDFLSQPHPR